MDAREAASYKIEEIRFHQVKDKRPKDETLSDKSWKLLVDGIISDYDGDTEEILEMEPEDLYQIMDSSGIETLEEEEYVEEEYVPEVYEKEEIVAYPDDIDVHYYDNTVHLLVRANYKRWKEDIRITTLMDCNLKSLKNAGIVLSDEEIHKYGVFLIKYAKYNKPNPYAVEIRDCRSSENDALEKYNKFLDVTKNTPEYLDWLY